MTATWNRLALTADQRARLQRLADHGPLVVGTRTTERVMGESGVRSLERRGFVIRFTVNPRHVFGMVRITAEGLHALEAADDRLQLFPDEFASPRSIDVHHQYEENVA